MSLGEARAVLSAARRVVVLTGAGMSAESGVPTFRGTGGLWRNHDPSKLATPEAFQEDPRLVWEWYAWRRSLVAACAPHEGHLALARYALSRPGEVTLITQNVDGLHEVAAIEAARTRTSEVADRAGRADASPALPLNLHGSLFAVRCTRCGVRRPHRGAIDTTGVDVLPRCAECGGLLRPDVVWFGEALDPTVIARAVRSAREADACLVVGTSALVHPAASLPGMTIEAGGRVLEVNLEVTPLTPLATIHLRGRAGEVLPRVLAEG